MIHKEGYTTILGTLVLSAILILMSKTWLPIIFIPLAIILSILLILILQFFRNPTRNISQFDNSLVYAPADGKVVIIEETIEAEYFKETRMLVSIFMSPLNVHVNRNPFSGLVKYFRYHPGKYFVAWHPKSSLENERTSLVIDNGKNEIMLRQVAGALARRIVSYIKEGDQVKQGEDFGFIKFGSRVDIYLPLDAKILVNLEQTVKGNKDIIAQL